MMINHSSPIGIFDSGYGGLTVFREIADKLSAYDLLYLGDNARTPYGPRSFDVVYEYTLDAVKKLFSMGCPLVILACNTASAKALRSVQQNDLPDLSPDNRVLGVIRPSVEMLGSFTQSGHVGVLGTIGTVRSESYILELQKLFPELAVTQEACPMWVPLVENREYDRGGADFFVKQHLDNLLERDPLIDTVILACTHYPLLTEKIRAYLPEEVKLIEQGPIVVESLMDYLKRHPEMDERLTKNGQRCFFTSEHPDIFSQQAALFLGEVITVDHLSF